MPSSDDDDCGTGGTPSDPRHSHRALKDDEEDEVCVYLSHSMVVLCTYRDCHGWSSIIAMYKEISVSNVF